MEVCYLSRRRTSGALPISWRSANLRAALKVSSDNKANWTLERPRKVCCVPDFAARGTTAEARPRCQ